MVKIDRNRKNPGSMDISSFGKRDIRQMNPTEKAAFSQDLLEKENQLYQVRMKELLSKIDDITGKLANNLNLDDLIRYKKVVQQFLEEATARSYIISKERSFTRRGARSVLVSVKRINQEVEELMKEFLGKKKEPVDVLETLDKIRGMLVDLMA
ncbi:MAG: YaaR family protein [Acidobacteriota bacterium]